MRSKWLKRFAVTLLCLILLTCLLVAGLGIYLRSDSFNRYVAGQIKVKLLEYGLRGEIGDFGISLDANKARLKDLQIYNQQTGQPIATIKSADIVLRVKDLYALKLSREVEIEKIALDGVELFVEIDDKGRTNFEGLRQATSTSKFLTFNTSRLLTSLSSSSIHVKDQLRKIETDLASLSAEIQPTAENADIVKLFCKSGEGKIGYEKRQARLDSLALMTRISATGAEIDEITFKTNVCDVKAKGKLDDWTALHYTFDVESRVKLDEAARFLAADVVVKGAAAATARIEGRTTGDLITGSLRSEQVEIAGALLHDVQISGIKIDAKKQQINFTGNRLEARSVVIDDRKLGQIVIQNVNGSHSKGETQISAPTATVADIEWPESKVPGLRLTDISAEITDNGRYEITALANAGEGQVGNMKFSNTTGKAFIDNDALVVSEIKGNIFGGNFTADLDLPLYTNTPAKLKAGFTGLQTKDAAAIFEGESIPISGTMRGELDLSFVGANPRSLNGAITTHFEGRANEKTDAIPLAGDVAIRLQDGVFNFDRATLSTDASKLTAVGKLSYDGNSDLRLTLSSSQSQEFLQLGRAFEAVRPFIEKYEPQLIGAFKFEGRVSGDIKNATIEGDVQIETAGLRDAILGSLAGHFVVSAKEARAENVVVTATNGGTLKFDLISPLDKKGDTGKLDATLDRISLETILASIGLPNANQFISGDVTGQAHLEGLPASLDGMAQIRLVDGKIADQPAEIAIAELKFDDKDTFLEKLEVKLPQSHLTATGSMNLQDYTFKVEGQADQIALENLEKALELQKTKIEGSADATFDISGKLIIAGKVTDLDWESLKVELSAQGKNVKVNGRESGELKLIANTSVGGRIDATLTTGILSRFPGKEEKRESETIKASIELRKEGRPAVIESDLSNLDIGPLLSLLAPDLVQTVKGTISGRFRIEGPTTDAKGAATFDLMRGGLTLVEANLQVADNPAKIETPAQFSLENSQIRIPVTHISGPGVDLNFSGALGMKNESPMNFSLKGAVNLDRLPPISSDIFLFGTVLVDARADGTVGEPRLNGRMEIAGFALSSSAQPIFINDGAGTITLSDNQVKLDRFTANANEGTIEASGVTKLDQFRPQEWKYVITANNVQIVLQDISGNISGNLTLTGTRQGQQLTGNVTIPQAEYKPSVDIDNLSVGGEASLSFATFDTSRIGIEKLGIPPVNLNIRVEARDSLIIRNEQINTVGAGLLVINGRLDDPDTNGRITLDGGTLRFRGQLYEITNGVLDLPAGGASPLLNLVAEKTTGGTRVYVGLVGPIDDLDLTLRSEPQLTRDEIVNLITTGRTEASTLNNQDPLITGVGTAASLLSSGFISRPAEQLLGLSRFQIDPVIRPNANPAARLTVGQQVLRNFYLSYSTNLATEQDQTALAEYTLSNRFSTLATYTQGGSAARQSVREGVFTIELRGRQRFSLGFNPPQTTGDTNSGDALSRIMRQKLPPAEVSVSEIPNLKLSSKKLRELLPVMNQGFSRSLARLGESRLREYLQEIGYFFADVKSRCEPENCTGSDLKLFYDIEPNVIYDLKEIRIEGTDLIELSDIESYLQSQTANRLGGRPILKDLPIIGGYVRGLTSNDRLNNDGEFIRNYLVDIGYRNARVKSRLAVKPDNDDLIIIFDVDAGTQTEIAETVVRGNTVLSAPELLKSIPVQANEAFSLTRTRAGVQKIKQLYAQRGFLETEVNLDIVELQDDRVKLVYNVSEGARAVVKEIEIAGTTKTSKGWIKRYFDFKEGDILTPSRIRQTQRDLYATNAFREVNLRAEPIGGDDGAAHRIMLNLTEAKPLLFVYGLGYSTDDGARGLLEIANTNLGGTLDSLSLRLRASRREQFSQLSFTDLRPFGTRLPTTISVFYNRNSNLIPTVRRKLIDENGKITQSDNNSTFGLERFAAFIQTERKLGERTSLRFRYNLERANLFNLDPNFFPETEVTRNEQATRLGMFSIGFTRDTRDSVLNPTRGQLISADHSLATKIFGGNESFNKFFATYQRYKTLDQFTPLLKDSTFAFSTRIGLAGVFDDADRNGNGKIDIPFEKNQRLPIGERFFSGGATTLRGFRFETAGPNIVLPPQQTTKTLSGNKVQTFTVLPTLFPVGGNALAIFNFELRYPLTKRLRLVPFYDFGNVFSRINDFSFGGMTSSVGMGLRINTPLGPIGVDYGFLINPPAFPIPGGELRQPRGAFHIRFGQTF